MGASRSSPAPCVNPDVFERRLLTKSVQQAGLDDQPSKTTQTVEFPPPAPSGSGAHFLVRRQSETTTVDSEDQQPFDIDDLQAWWKRGLTEGRAESPSRDRKLIQAAGALVAVAIVGSVLALKLGAPRESPVNDMARAPSPSGEIASTFADVSTTPSTGLSRTALLEPAVETQAVQSLASTSAKPAEPGSARTASMGLDGTLIATQIPSAAGSNEASSAPDVRKPTAKSTPESPNRVVATAYPSIPWPTRRPGKTTTRAMVATTESAAPLVTADTPIPPLPIGTLVKPEEAGAAKAVQPVTEIVAAPATSAQAANQSPNPLMRAVGNLSGARSVAEPADPIATESTGWAVHLAAAKSKAEAKRVLKQFNAKYGSALSTSRTVLHKALINREAVYGLRVVGLSMFEAEALCARLKDDGGNCFIVR